MSSSQEQVEIKAIVWNSDLQRMLINCPYCPTETSLCHTMNISQAPEFQFLTCGFREHHGKYIQETGTQPEIVVANPVKESIPCPFCPTETNLCHTMNVREMEEFGILDCGFWEHYHRYNAKDDSITTDN